MAQEQEPARKVEKRVIKKTVVKRPVASRPAPTVRYGRSSATPVAQPARSKAAPKLSTHPKTAKSPAMPRPSRELGKKAGAAGKAFGQHGGKVLGAVGVGAKGATHSVGGTLHSGYASVRSFHLPRIEQTKAAAIVGVVIGLITVVITGLLTMMFSHFRGVATGGGKWGSLTVVIVAFIAFAIGEFLLAKMYVRQPRITSFLGLVMTLVLIMALFIGPIYTVWAWLIMPILGAGTFALAHRLIAVTDSSPREI